MIQINKDFKNNELPIFLRLFAPILIFLIFLIINQLNPTFFSEFFQGEKGFIENGTFFILLISIITNFSVIKKIKTKEYNIQYFLMIIFLIGLVYFAGEEISWGQHWFNWETNNFFKNFNDQSETNFHNMSSWFDQKPRLLLTYFVIITGIFCPFLNKKNILTEFIKLLNNHNNNNDKQIINSKKFIDSLVLNKSPAVMASIEIRKLLLPKPLKY